MIELSPKNLEADFRGLLLLHFAHKVFRRRSGVVYECDVGHPQTLAGMIGRGSIVAVRCKKDRLVGPKSQPLKSGKDHVLKLGSHDHEIEAEDEAAAGGALQQNG